MKTTTIRTLANVFFGVALTTGAFTTYALSMTSAAPPGSGNPFVDILTFIAYLAGSFFLGFLIPGIVWAALHDAAKKRERRGI